MGFRIYAAGVDGFSFSRDNNPDEDIFVAADVLTAMRVAAPDGLGAFDAGSALVVPGADDAARIVGDLTFASMLRDNVNALAMCAQAAHGWISVVARRSRQLGPNMSRFARYEFVPSNSPASDFMRLMLPVLNAVNMNNFGSLRAMAMALGAYFAHIGIQGCPMIQMELSTSTPFWRKV